MKLDFTKQEFRTWLQNFDGQFYDDEFISTSCPITKFVSNELGVCCSTSNTMYATDPNDRSSWASFHGCQVNLPEWTGLFQQKMDKHSNSKPTSQTAIEVLDSIVE